MNQPRISRSMNQLSVAKTRKRETPPPARPFRTLVASGAQVLLSGAATASKVIGLPAVTAAVSRARSGIDLGTGGTGGSEGASAGGPATLDSMVDQNMSDDLKLLSLQREIQRRDRAMTMVSNVMKARHDTAKAAINNLRA